MQSCRFKAEAQLTERTAQQKTEQIHLLLTAHLPSVRDVKAAVGSEVAGAIVAFRRTRDTGAPAASAGRWVGAAPRAASARGWRRAAGGKCDPVPPTTARCSARSRPPGV